MIIMLLFNRIHISCHVLFIIPRYWCKNDLVDVWNVSDLVDVAEEKMKLLHHTSNVLESYNKVFNAICPTKHLNLVVFVCALCREADCVLQRMDNVAK